VQVNVGVAAFTEQRGMAGFNAIRFIDSRDPGVEPEHAAVLAEHVHAQHVRPVCGTRDVERGGA
jgi:hypothetical protein